MERAEFLDAVKAAGHEMSDRMLTDWISRGLVASPRRISDGRGTNAEYNENQLRLTIELLNKHEPGQGLDPLYNVPVAMWLYWHNQGIVPLSHARRALGTWVERRTRGARSSKQAIAAAGDLVQQFRAAGFSKARASELTKTLGRANITGKLDLDEVKRTLGPDVEKPQIAGMLWIFERFVAGIEHFDDFTDDDFRQARGEHLAQLGLPGYPRNNNIPELMRNACRNLTGHLGELTLRR